MDDFMFLNKVDDMFLKVHIFILYINSETAEQQHICVISKLIGWIVLWFIKFNMNQQKIYNFQQNN